MTLDGRRMPALSDSRPLWHVVVSVKSLARAKSRLAVLGDTGRRALAAGMAEDVIAAVVCAPSVVRVVVVCDDPALIRMAHSYGAGVIPDPGGGLNTAFERGMRSAAAAGGWTCLLPADLPCLTPEVVDNVLAAAAPYERAVVPDLAGTGTTLLACAPWDMTPPQFGPGSFRRHVAAGAQPVATDFLQARCDVDTPQDLRRALRIGVGRHTAVAAAGLQGAAASSGVPHFD